MYRAPHPVAGQGGEIERLGHHALAGEGGVAVDEHGQRRGVLGVAPDVLLGPGHALHHRVDRFQMGRVGSQRQGQRPSIRGGVDAGRAQVVLHVARPLGERRIQVAFELPEDLAVGLAHRIGQHVEPAPVGHAQHRLLHTGVDGVGEEGVEEGDEALGSFQAEALMAQVLGGQEPLEGLRRPQALQDAALVVGWDVDAGAFQPGLDPGFLVGLLDMHVLHADGAGVGVAQHAQDVGQRHHLGAGQAAGGEAPLQVPDGEPVVSRVELVVGARPLAPQRIQVGDEVPPHPVDIDELENPGLLVDLVFGVVLGVVVPPPAHRLVGDTETAEDVVVETVLAEEQLVDVAEELARLRPLDDAVVVGGRERHDLAHPETGDGPGVGPLVLGWVVDGAHPDDGALAGHQAGDGVNRADGAGIGERDGRAGEVLGGDLAGAHPADDVLVGREVGGEVEGVGLLDVGDEEAVGAVGAGDVDGQTQIDVGMADHARSAVFDGGVAGVHDGHAAQRLDHGVADQVGEAHLAGALHPGQVVVHHPPVPFQQPGGDDPGRGGRRHPQRGLHVLHDPGRRPADGSGSVHRPRRGGLGRSGAGRRLRTRRRRRLLGGVGRSRLPSTIAAGGHVVLEEIAPRFGHRRRVLLPLAVQLLDHADVRSEVLDVHLGVSQERARSSPDTWKARSSDWRALRRGSHIVS